jgi:xanthine dehydrogenase YagS FAD-binding subunit
LGELKRRIRKPERLINLKTIPELKGMDYDQDLRIGALVTLSEIERHPAVSGHFQLLLQANSLTSTPQLRNMGTVAGNLCQHPRCWYYRSVLFPCWLKGGQKCFAVRGENKYHAILGCQVCHAVHPSDLAPALIALDARVRLVDSMKESDLSLAELYANPTADHRQMTILNPAQLITEIRVPAPPKGSRTIYLKAMERRSWSFALVSVAANLTMDKDCITEARLVLGGVAPIPWRARDAEGLLQGQKFSQALADRAGEAAMAGARPLRDNQYKVSLTKGLIRKALAALVQKIT